MNIFTLTGTILVDNSKAIDSIQKTEGKADSFASKLGAGIKTAGAMGAAVAAGAAVAGGALVALATKASEAASSIDDASQRTGMNAETFQQYAYAAKLSGMETEALEKAMIKQQKAFSDAAEGSKTASEAYARLGIDISEVGSSSEAFDMVIERLAGMTNETERNALANDIFGKSYADLSPLLNEGAAGIAKLKQEAVDMGAVMSGDAVAAGAQFGDTIDSLKMAFGGVTNEIGSAFLPVLQQILDWIIENMPAIQEFIGEVVDFVTAAIEEFKVFWEENGAAITAITKVIFDAIKAVVQTAMDILRGVINVVMGLIKGDFEQAWNGLIGILNGFTSLFKKAGEALMTAVWDGMKSIFTSLSEWISEKAEWIAEKLAFWQNSQAQMAGARVGAINGSNASGLAYVPFDGYVSQLHKGERVLTAEENKSYSDSKPGVTNTWNVAINVKSASEAISELDILNKKLVMA